MQDYAKEWKDTHELNILFNKDWSEASLDIDEGDELETLRVAVKLLVDIKKELIRTQNMEKYLDVTIKL